MPKLSSYKRLITNDFEEDQKAIVEKIAGPINDSFNELYFANNGRLSIKENLYCTYREIDVTVNSSGIPTSRTIFSLTHKVPVLGIEVIRAENQVNTTSYPTGAPFISYSQLDNTVLINHITGLQANTRYIIKLIAWH